MQKHFTIAESMDGQAVTALTNGPVESKSVRWDEPTRQRLPYSIKCEGLLIRIDLDRLVKLYARDVMLSKGKQKRECQGAIIIKTCGPVSITDDK